MTSRSSPPAALRQEFGAPFVGRDEAELELELTVPVDLTQQLRAIGCHGSQLLENTVPTAASSSPVTPSRCGSCLGVIDLAGLGLDDLLGEGAQPCTFGAREQLSRAGVPGRHPPTPTAVARATNVAISSRRRSIPGPDSSGPDPVVNPARPAASMAVACTLPSSSVQYPVSGSC